MTRKRKPKKKRKQRPAQAIGAAVKRRGTKGSFRAWCVKQGFSGATSACIARGLKSKSKAIRAKAKAAKAYATMRKGRKKKK